MSTPPSMARRPVVDYNGRLLIGFVADRFRSFFRPR